MKTLIGLIIFCSSCAFAQLAPGEHFVKEVPLKQPQTDAEKLADERENFQLVLDVCEQYRASLINWLPSQTVIRIPTCYDAFIDAKLKIITGGKR